MERAIVCPKLIDDVLQNPGIGFMTFQRFNGDQLNEGLKWTEGKPIVYQPFNGDLHNPNHPDTTLSYFRVYWRYIEPEEGKYNWELIDKALRTSHERGQTMLFRLAVHAHNYLDTGDDLPDWFRAMVGPKDESLPPRWVCDHNDPRYVKYFSRVIREIGKRYDGHPDLESVDMSLCGPWGEGAHSHMLSEPTMKALCDAYIDSFTRTPLLAMLEDTVSNKYIMSRCNAGYRADCLGDLRGGPFSFCHMLDRYPQQIVAFGVKDAWMKAPVSFEVCGVMGGWLERGYDLDYIIEQSLKWHISSFNAKSSAVPAVWKEKVDGWLKRMGYRLALRRIDYSASVCPGGTFGYDSWWENRGVAPCYKKFPLAFRLTSDAYTFTHKTDADITAWLPGDTLCDSTFHIPFDMPFGTYRLQVGILGLAGDAPAVRLGIEGRTSDGWYDLGDVVVAADDPSPLPAYERYFE